MALGAGAAPAPLHQATVDSEAELARVMATLRDLRSQTYQALDRVSGRGRDLAWVHVWVHRLRPEHPCSADTAPTHVLLPSNTHTRTHTHTHTHTHTRARTPHTHRRTLSQRCTAW
jgi:hypothetical protein